MDNKHDRRVSDIQINDAVAEVRQVDIRLNRLEAVTENLSTGLSTLSSDVRSLAKLMREGNKTNWSVLATWAGVIMMLVIALGNGYVGAPLSQLRQDTQTLFKTVNEHKADGHPKSVLTKMETSFAARDAVQLLTNKQNNKTFELLFAEVARLRDWRNTMNEGHRESEQRIRERVEAAKLIEYNRTSP